MKKSLYPIAVVLILIIVLFVVYYLVIFLPQRKAPKESNKELLEQCLIEADEGLSETLGGYESIVSEEYIERIENLYQKEREECYKKYPLE